MNKIKGVLAYIGGHRPKEIELRELRNRVALLEIQSGRLKEERDEARAHIARIRQITGFVT